MVCTTHADRQTGLTNMILGVYHPQRQVNQSLGSKHPTMVRLPRLFFGFGFHSLCFYYVSTFAPR